MAWSWSCERNSVACSGSSRSCSTVWVACSFSTLSCSCSRAVGERRRDLRPLRRDLAQPLQRQVTGADVGVERLAQLGQHGLAMPPGHRLGGHWGGVGGRVGGLRGGLRCARLRCRRAGRGRHGFLPGQPSLTTVPHGMTLMLTIASGAASGTASNRLAPNEPGAARVVASHGDGARLRADHAGRIADAARLAVEDVWGTAAFATAVGNLTVGPPRDRPGRHHPGAGGPAPVVVGNLGYDVSFTLPKSYSLLLAFADSDTAAAVEAVYTERVGRTFGWLEASAPTGCAATAGTARARPRWPGFLGWSMVHRAARPVAGRTVGDPHCTCTC